METTPDTPDTPAALRWAVGLIWLEAVAAGGFAVLLGYQAVVAEAASRVDAIALTGFVLLLAVALSGLALALARHKPRARAPALVLQLFAVMAGVIALFDGPTWWPLPVIAFGVTVATLLLHPKVNSLFGTGGAAG